MSIKRKINMTSASPRGWHRLQLATECLQKYAFTYEEQVDAEGNKPAKAEVKGPGLIRGSLMHLALAQHYSIMRTLQEGGERDEWSEPETAVELIARRDNGLKFLDDVIHTYREYCKTYPFEREIKTHKIVAVEDLYQTMIGGKWLLTGRVDLAYENQAGEIIVVDHKCIPISSRVLTSSGIKTVAELIEAGTDWTCMAWDGKKAVASKALCPEPAGVQPIFELALGDGTVEKFGHTHPIYTKRGWVPASEVVKGDIVGLANEDKFWWVAVNSTQPLPDELCYSIEVPEHHTFLLSSGLITHNTTGRLTKAHDSYYSTHGQLFGYFHLAKKHFGEEKVGGFKVNLIEVSQNPKFNRIDLGRAPLIESTFEQNVIDIEERIVHIKEKNRPLDEWPKSINELTCYGRYGACQFMQRCKFGAAANQWVWEDE